MDADQHIALLVHILQYLEKFILGGHDRVIVGAVRVPVKGLGGIHDKGVEKNVGDSVHIGWNQGGLL